MQMTTYVRTIWPNNDNDQRFTAIAQDQPASAPPVKNWRILLEQTFTARMPLLMATSAFGLGRRRWSSYQQCYLHCLCTFQCSLINERIIRLYVRCLHQPTVTLWFLCDTHSYNGVKIWPLTFDSGQCTEQTIFLQTLADYIWGRQLNTFSF